MDWINYLGSETVVLVMTAAIALILRPTNPGIYAQLDISTMINFMNTPLEALEDILMRVHEESMRGTNIDLKNLILIRVRT
jgi:hypothetical protein